MKKFVRSIMPLLLLGSTVQAQRFTTEVFPSAQKTADIVYGSNFQVLTGSPQSVQLKLDIYEPSGMTDTMALRPLIVFLHTGSYLPAVLNGTPTGSRNDSAAIEICTRFARRGFVVANVDYRLGWNPAGSNVDIRRGTLINAVFRSIQDAKAAVRYMRSTAKIGNAYKIDTTKFIIGGQGTGGYIALNYVALKTAAQIQIPKFISNITDATYGFQAGQPYVNLQALGDFDGYGGLPTLNNSNNSPGHTNDVQFVFNMGGALGDSSWLTAGQPPMVAFHLMGDPFAPYGNGIVYVPGNPPQSVVDVSGSGVVIPKANALGNNDCFRNATYNDPYTARANAVNGGQEGLFPFVTVPALQAGPWEWWDSSVVVATAIATGLPAANGTAAHTNGLITNPNMSRAKAVAYIDTIMNYLNPRIVECLGLKGPTGIAHAVRDNSVKIYPNPAATAVTVSTGLAGNLIRDIRVTDLSGRIVKAALGINAIQHTISRDGLSSGLYLIDVQTTRGRVTQKLTIE